MTAAPPDQRARHELRSTLLEVDRLARAARLPEDAFPEVLRVLQEAMGALSGTVWSRDREGRLFQLCEAGDARHRWTGKNSERAAVNEWIVDALKSGESRWIGDAEEQASEFACGPASNRLISVVHHDGSPAFVVEVRVRAGLSDDACRGLLLFLEQACGTASQAFASRPKIVEPGEFARSDLENFCWLLWQSNRLADVASIVATDGRALLGCDRLTVVLRRGNVFAVQAVSNQKSIHPRSNMTQALVRLSEQVAATDEPFVFHGQVGRLPPKLERTLAEFLDESGAREVTVLPIYAPQRPAETEAENSGSRRRCAGRKPIGALVIEELAGSPADPASRLQLGVMADHAGAALANALAREKLPLLSLWTRLGDWREQFLGSRLANAGAAAGCVLFAALALFLIPWEYRVEAEGKLMPVHQQRIFAPADGEIIGLHVHAGDRVAEGTVLLSIRSDELQEKLVAASNQRMEKERMVASLRARIRDAVRLARKDDEYRLQGELEETLVSVRGLSEQIRLLEERQEKLEVKSPRAGVVATFQLEQLLLHRPVRRGDLLLEVMDEAGPWRLEVQVPEHRMFHVLRSWERTGSEGLPMQFVSATRPEETFAGELQEISTRAATDDSAGRVVQVHVGIDREALPDRRIGSEVRARIATGPRSLGYVLFGDIIEFAQRRFWWW